MRSSRVQHFAAALSARTRRPYLVSLLLASLAAQACGEHTTAASAVQSVVLSELADTLRVGESHLLPYTVKNSAGAVINDAPVFWISSDPAVASVSSLGIVTALAAGHTTITASAAGQSGSTVLTVISGDPMNYTIRNAFFTQGVQNTDASIPIVLGGNAAVLNVFVTSTYVANTQRMQMVLRLFNGAGALIRTDTAFTGTMFLPGVPETLPTAQFLVPSNVLQAGMRWQVVRDPRHLSPDAVGDDDVYPRAGPATLATTTVAPLKVKFVPIRLTQYGSGAAPFTSADIPDFTRSLLSVYPLGSVSTTVAAPISSDANFGTAPIGAPSSFWDQLLGDLDLARVLGETDPTVHWMGIVRPPPGFTYATFGGVAYVPTVGTATGPRTRTSVVVGPGWFSDVTKARIGMAHELGHNFSRRHAPCGGATGVDPLFPNSTGVIDMPGFDVFAWATAETRSAAAIDGNTADIMGYCTPVWTSPYTYQAVMQFRGTGLVASNLTAEREAVLIVRGAVERGKGVSLQPVFAANAIPARPELNGPYNIELLDDAGRVLYSASFSPAVSSNSDDYAPFTFAIPATEAFERSLSLVRVSGPAGVAVAQAQPGRDSVDLHGLNSATVTTGVSNSYTPTRPRRDANAVASASVITVFCRDTASAGILVQHAITGALMATASRGSVVISEVSGTPIAVLCSDGLHTVRSAMIVP